MRFNTMREQFPNNFVVNFFGSRFSAAQHLEIEEGKSEVPKVEFD